MERPAQRSLFSDDPSPPRTEAVVVAPLAARMRPRSLDEFVGQRELVGPGGVLRQLLERGPLPSMILWGPPGCGKTTLALLLAELAGSAVVSLSAVDSGVAELRAARRDAMRHRAAGRSTVLFVDELHRWSKAQQDAVLPHVESGLLTLIGATTENPGFEVIAPLRSRVRLFHLWPLEDADLRRIVERALSDDRGLGAGVVLDEAAETLLLRWAGGDARSALMLLDLAASATEPDADGTRRISLEVIERVAQRPILDHDRAGANHYDVISALIKSTRGSDPDAAVFWLARALEAGEDPLFVARRLVILAAEDIGLAEPQALPLAVATYQATHVLGWPECYLPLCEATLFLALAPKSNSALVAYQAAKRDLEQHPAVSVPLHLRNAVTALDRAEGHGQGYRYAHDFPGGVAPQVHLPEERIGAVYYEGSAQGAEATLVERAARLRRQLMGADSK